MKMKMDKQTRLTRRQFLACGTVAAVGMALPTEIKGAEKGQEECA